VDIEYTRGREIVTRRGPGQAIRIGRMPLMLRCDRCELSQAAACRAQGWSLVVTTHVAHCWCTWLMLLHRCVLHNRTEAELSRLGECPLDPGGYFIVPVISIASAGIGDWWMVLMHECRNSLLMGGWVWGQVSTFSTSRRLLAIDCASCVHLRSPLRPACKVHGGTCRDLWLMCTQVSVLCSSSVL